ncbi:GNAT family N-acetyltransferase [Castellaniella ginsengisoli]|uniref:GNAT family N-acetyltransferase n=1 Tax=Castellaniella ginsengisoli TaxID=546114 RepID=A0AB39D7U3_9BURK
MLSRDQGSPFRDAWTGMGSLMPVEGALIIADEQDAGFVVLHLGWGMGDGMELYKLYIAPSFRGRGIGRQVVDMVAEWARDNRRTSIMLEADPRSWGFWTAYFHDVSGVELAGLNFVWTL